MGVRQAWWWLVDYLWAAVAWLGTPFAPPSTRYRTGTGTGRTVVIVPGVYENWAFLRPLIVPLHASGHSVHVLTELGHNRRPIADGAAALLGYLEGAGLSDVVVVAHSKGGLIGKLALADDPAGRIAEVVTICTPFGGSSRAHLLPLPSLRPLVPGHSTLTALADLEAVNSRITSIYGPWDPHLPEGSELTGGTNVQVSVPGHFRPLGASEVHAAVLAALAR